MFEFDEDEDPIESVSRILKLDCFNKESGKSTKAIKSAMSKRVKELEASLRNKNLSSLKRQDYTTELNVLKESLSSEEQNS